MIENLNSLKDLGGVKNSVLSTPATQWEHMGKEKKFRHLGLTYKRQFYWPGVGLGVGSFVYKLSP